MDRAESSRTSADINSIAPKQRRLDSIASLLQGYDPCAAVFFNGQQIIVATNKPSSRQSGIGHDPADNILQYLSFLASKSYILKTDPEKTDVICQEIQEKAAHILEMFLENDLLSDNYKGEFQSSFLKSTESILDTVSEGEKPKALDPKFIEALANKHFIQVYNTNADKNIHAEMKLVDHILMGENDGSSSGGFKPQVPPPSYYIGISKKCCPTCSANLKALKDTAGAAISLQYRSDTSHGEYFPSRPPKFTNSSNFSAETKSKLAASILRNCDIPVGQHPERQLPALYQLPKTGPKRNHARDRSTSPAPNSIEALISIFKADQKKRMPVRNDKSADLSATPVVAQTQAATSNHKLTYAKIAARNSIPRQ